LGDVYKNPFNEQQIFAGISIPVVDWGRKKAAVSMADADILQATLWVEKEKQQISNTIQQLVSNLKEVQQRVIQQKEIVKISEARYNISKERYFAGVVPVNELFMAQSAKDLAIRNYLNGLRNLYVSYHDLLRLTGTNITRQFIQ
jgi:outer membrane protein TolC